MRPVCKVETYTGAVLDHTITSENIGVYYKNSLNDNVGTFQATIPNTSTFSDIAIHDKVKIYLGYETVPASASFVGYIEKITGILNPDKKVGYQKIISGYDLGEILLRRLTENKYWQSVEMSTIVNELANTDLGLGVDKDNTAGKSATIQVDGETYFDILRKVSDYWLSAASNVQRDFYCATDGDLQWKSRPIRTAGVSTPTLGKTIQKYTVFKSGENVRNWIKIYGSVDPTNIAAITPTDENWTDTNNDPAWSATTGALTFPSAAPAPDAGTRYVRCDSADIGGGVYAVSFGRTFSPEHPVHIDGRIGLTKNYSFNQVRFAAYSTAITTKKLYILAPNLANSWYQSFNSTATTWTDNIWNLEAAVSGGGWGTVAGSPDWENIRGIWWYITYAGTPSYCCIDDLSLRGGHFYTIAQDTTSQTNYGRRDMIQTDKALNTQTAVTERALSLLYQRKEPATQIDLEMVGDTNLLIGDRISLTLPVDGISGNYYVQTVEQMFGPQKFESRIHVIDTVNTRQLPYSNMVSLFTNVKRGLNMLGADARTVH